MIDHVILRLLARRGVWMTPVEIFAASPDYPVGDYVIEDLKSLIANELIVSRRRQGSSLAEYGLPSWVDARVPATTLLYLGHLIRSILRRLLAIA